MATSGGQARQRGARRIRSLSDSPRPLELLDPEREGRTHLCDAAELDHEVRRGGGVGSLEDHERVRLPEEAEELVHDDVVRELRVLEHPGRLLELPGDDIQQHHEEHGLTPPHASGGRYLTVGRSPSAPATSPSIRCRRTWISDDCATVVPRTLSDQRWRGSPSTSRPASVSRSGKANQNSFGMFRTAAFDHVIGPRRERTSSPTMYLPTVARKRDSANVAYR